MKTVPRQSGNLSQPNAHQTLNSIKHMSEQELKDLERFARMKDPLPGCDLWIIKASDTIINLVTRIRKMQCSLSHQSKVSLDPSGLQDSPASSVISEDVSSP